MIHDGALFDLPGREFTYEAVDLDQLAAPVDAALGAIASAVEPTVVEVVTEGGAIHQLRGADKRGGAYGGTTVRTRDVDRIDAFTLVSWAREIESIATVSIRDGWYRVTAEVGETLRVGDATGVVASHNGAAVRAPDQQILLPPFGANLDVMSGRLTLAVHWSQWTDANGVGHAWFEHMRGELAGWRLVSEPEAESLDWQRWVRRAPIVRLRPASPASIEWSAVPDSCVELGLSLEQRERLADELLAIDRATDEADTPVAYRGYDAVARRAEIVTALAVSVGRMVCDVTAFEIMQRPVSNKMWAAYMAKTGALRPASWSAGPPPDDDPVTGISQAEAAAFAVHHGWALPTEAEWELGSRAAPPILDGLCEYTNDLFAAYPGGDPSLFAVSQVCARGSAAKLPPCIEARRGLARDHRFKFARFRCVR